VIQPVGNETTAGQVHLSINSFNNPTNRWGNANPSGSSRFEHLRVRSFRKPRTCLPGRCVSDFADRERQAGISAAIVPGRRAFADGILIKFRAEQRRLTANPAVIVLVAGASPRLQIRRAHMLNASSSKDSQSARIAIVEQHIRFENDHDLEGVLRTFGETAHYDDEPWSEHYTGLDGVRLFYGQLMKALPDLEIAVQRRHVAEDAILVEVVIRGTHLGGWRGLPATGRRVEFPLCGVYTFDADDRLAGEKIYYDRGSVLRQLGVFHEPRSALGQICIVATHPITIARALVRKLLRT